MKTPPAFYQFGFEIEYHLKDLSRFINDPDLRPLHPALQNNWHLSSEDKIHLLTELLKNSKLGDRTQYFEMPFADYNWIFFRDDSKNLEITSPVYPDFTSMQKTLDLLIKKLGPGSLQATVSLPSDLFFDRTRDPQSRQKELLGWFVFHTAFDAMTRLQRNVIQKKSGVHLVVGKFLSHPFLGPLTAQKKHLLRKYLRENSQHQLLDEDSLTLVKKREHSFKFVSSTIYRPDLTSRERVCLEIRDVHKDLNLLYKRIQRVTQDFPAHLAHFKMFSPLQGFDQVNCFEKLSSDQQAYLQNLFPSTIPDEIKDKEKALIAHETYRIFSWPLALWEEWVDLLQFPELTIESIRLARQSWQRALESLCSKNEINIENQSLVGELIFMFFEDSKLLSALNFYRSKYGVW